MKLWRRAHKLDWWPGTGPRAVIVPPAQCLHPGCKERKIMLPWGQCLGGEERHSLSDHYYADGTRRDLACCQTPL